MNLIKKIVFFVFFISFLFFFLRINKPNIFPETKFSTLILDQNNEILTARTSEDKQWRFKLNEDSIPKNYIESVILFEDKYFYYHFGVNFFSIGRAIIQNYKAQKIKSGASTITMQLARKIRNRKGKSYLDKIIEIGLAFWIEIAYSKNEIIKAYCQIAPFGGNIVGLEAASWKFFGKKSPILSWSEAALLAILPNNPTKLYPGKNNNFLINKRNLLLLKLFQNNKIPVNDYKSSILEPLPNSIIKFENNAPHILDYLLKNQKSNIINTSLSKYYQIKINEILKKYSSHLFANGIQNACVLVLDVKQNSVLAYIGNLPNTTSENNKDVDIIQSPRSTGSILKPLLFAMNLNDGKLLSSSLVADIPTIIAGYAPKNYDLGFDGAVPFSNAIHRSLNVPAVRVLQEYGIEQFHFNLKNLGISTLRNAAPHYGLSIILGGAEATLWDICNIYAGMARTLQSYNTYNTYCKTDLKFSEIINLKHLKPYKSSDYTINSLLSAYSIFQTFEAMNEVSRPDQEEGWKLLTSSKIAWKTGTSFGNRDAWAIGCTPEYVVGIWAGNADGEGRANLTGIKIAAPIMFDIFNILKNKTWFKEPENDKIKAEICSKSGFRKSKNCELLDTVNICKSGVKSPLCMYCKEIITDITGKYRIHLNCENNLNIKSKKYFSLPPTMEYYYKSKHADYQIIPPYRSDCSSETKQNEIEIVYPLPFSKIFIPKKLDTKKGKVTLQVAFKGKGKIFWHIDKEFISETNFLHQLSIEPTLGKHILTVEDENGNRKSINFEIVD